MPLVVKDRVQETSTTTGTGTYTLAGAVTGYQSFSVIGNANTTYYAATNGTDWEVGIGTYTSSGTTLSRDTILESSNAGAAVSWGAGTKNIFVTYPAERSVATDAANTFTNTNVIDVNSSSTALRITQTGTGNALVVEDSANPDATPFVVSADGRVGIGTSSPTTIFDVVGDGFILPQTRAYGASAGAYPTIIRGRGTAASPSIIQSGDAIGGLQFSAFDGSANIAAALIRADVDGTPGTNDMPGRLVFSTTADGASSPTERMRIGNSGIISLGAVPGAESLRVTPSAGAVDYVEIIGSNFGRPVIRGVGAAANVSLGISSQGSGALQFYTNNTAQEQFRIAHTGSAVNYLQLTGGATTVGPTITFTGSDTNVNGLYNTKGTGSHTFYTGGNPQFFVAATASAVNYVEATGAGTGAVPGFFARGSDTNVSFGYRSKGSGGHFFYSDGGSNVQFAVARTASAVNYLQVTGGAIGVQPVLSAQGSDTNIPLQINTKGTGNLAVVTGGGVQFNISNTASAVNYVQATGGATGNAVTLSAQGSDANINLALAAKGTGSVTTSSAFIATGGISGGTF